MIVGGLHNHPGKQYRSMLKHYTALLIILAPVVCQAESRARLHALPFVQTLQVPITDFEIMRAGSGHCQEYFLKTSSLSAKGLEIKNTWGRSCSRYKPWLMIRNRHTHEGLGLLLGYSGNWEIQVKPTDSGITEVRAATLPDNLPLLDTVNGIALPGVLVSEFKGHWDEGSNAIKRFIREKLLRDHGRNWPPFQYNTWYDRTEALEEGRLMDFARLAAELGCELFVIDAGWYGLHMDWRVTKGDWRVNAKKLPRGTRPVADLVRSLGMKFGMWVEIELAGSEAPITKEHPEWFFRSGGKLVSNRGVLYFGNPEVVAWAKSQIDKIVTENQLDYLKMDFNSDMAVTGDRDSDGNEKLWAHYRGLVELWKYIRNKYPNLIVENCSSGSLRQDLLPAAYTDNHWVSDSIKPHECLAMNYGATYLFPPEYCMHWTAMTTASECMDLQSVFNVTLMGMPGLSGPLSTWDDLKLFYAADRIALYKIIRNWLCRSDVYHLTDQVDPRSPKSVQAVQYVIGEGECSVIFVFHGGDSRYQATIKPKGLNPNTTYHVDMPPAFGSDLSMRGDKLAGGLPIRFPGAGSSAVIRIVPVCRSLHRLAEVTGLTVGPVDILNARDPVSLAVSWDVVPDAYRYVIHMGRKGHKLRPIDESFIPRYIINNLEPETEYQIRVHAEAMSGGRSELSPITTARTRSICVEGSELWLQPWQAHVQWPNNISKRWGWTWAHHVGHYQNLHKIETMRNRNIFGEPLSIRGNIYAAGIGTRAGSKLTFDLTRLPAGKGKAFSATVGIDDRALGIEQNKPVAVFVVAADGKEVYRSEALSMISKPAIIKVPLPSGARKLSLMVEPVEKIDPRQHIYTDWIKPMLM